ncbi:MAG: thioredoxin family protein [Bacteroidales bacterium]|nr:thioredoxin family protein [Bacteroidales bacterium]
MKGLRSFFVGIVLSLAFAFPTWAQGDLDSLGRLLNEYARALDAYGAAYKSAECDDIIAYCRNDSTRRFAARHLFQHYMDSPLMGDEAVAIHLYDRWFAEGKGAGTSLGKDGAISFASEEEAFSARIFVEANRQSLLGMTAPALRLYDGNDHEVALFSSATEALPEGISSIASDGRLRVLYFYATDCSVCKLYSKQLEVLLSRFTRPIDLMAVYTGKERESWESYARERLSWKASNVRIFNLWDAEGKGEFVTRYGVLSTPRLFLIDTDGTIIGRRLDPEALRMLFELMEEDNLYAYGDEHSRKLFEGLLPVDDLTIPAITETMNLIQRISQDKGNPAVYRHMTGDLLYYLNSHEDENTIEVCDWFIREYILSDKIAWKGENDSLSVLHLAEFLHELYSKAAPGTPVPAVRAYIEELVPDVPATKIGLKGKYRLDALKKRCRFKKRDMLLVFYDPACNDCQEQLAKARELACGSEPPVVILINVEDNLARLGEKERQALLDAFDLSSLPYLLRLAPDGTITRRYFKL